MENFSLPVEPYAENYPFDYPDEDRINLAPYLHVQYPEDTPALRDWLKPFLPERGQIHTRNVLQNITEAIREDFRYAAREAMGTQRPAETLARRSGTCQHTSGFQSIGRSSWSSAATWRAWICP